MTLTNWYPFAENKVEIMREIYRLQHRLHIRRLLELGAFIGNDSLLLAKLCEELICLEGREENALELRKRLAEFSLDVDVRVVNLESISLVEEIGYVDCVWASGILYHLPQPWKLMQEIAEISDICLGWTHLSTTAPDIARCAAGYHGRLQNEEIEKPLAGLSNSSFWLTEVEFVRAWHDVGMSCRWLTPRCAHPNGDVAAQFMVVR